MHLKAKSPLCKNPDVAYAFPCRIAHVFLSATSHAFLCIKPDSYISSLIFHELIAMMHHELNVYNIALIYIYCV